MNTYKNIWDMISKKNSIRFRYHKNPFKLVINKEKEDRLELSIEREYLYNVIRDNYSSMKPNEIETFLNEYGDTHIILKKNKWIYEGKYGVKQHNQVHKSD